MKTCSRCGKRRSKGEMFRPRRNQCRICEREMVAEWQRNNPKKKRANDRKYYRQNAEKVNTSVRNWKLRNPEKVRGYVDKWQQENREHFLEQKREYRAQNKERLNEYSQQYRRENPEKGRVYNLRRRARIRNAEGSFGPEEWEELKRKYKNRCLWCGEKEPLIQLTVDHVIPLSAGGSNSIDNIQPLCIECNCKKYTKVMDFR